MDSKRALILFAAFILLNHQMTAFSSEHNRTVIHSDNHNVEATTLPVLTGNIIQANNSCRRGFRKDKNGKCRKSFDN